MGGIDLDLSNTLILGVLKLLAFFSVICKLRRAIKFILRVTENRKGTHWNFRVLRFSDSSVSFVN